MFLLNSRYRSYRVNLPSSFNIITSFAFIYSTNLHAFELVRFVKLKYFLVWVAVIKKTNSNPIRNDLLKQKAQHVFSF